MILAKRLLCLLAAVLGFVGVVLCVLAVVLVWVTGSRLRHANEVAFDGVDQALVTVRARVLDAQEHVEKSKVTTEEIGQRLKTWARRETADRLVSQLEIEERAGELALGIERADAWLQVSRATMDGIQQALELGHEMGMTLDAGSIAPVIEKLSDLQGKLKQAARTVDDIRQRAAQRKDGGSIEQRMEQAVQLALRVAATLGEVDSHLAEAADKLSESRTEARALEAKIRAGIFLAAVTATLLIGWMAAGQASLCWLGARRVRQRPSSAEPRPGRCAEGEFREPCGEE